ncbi:MAG: PIN domain-containing protein [Gemmatimonadota bacterium]
MRRFFDTNVLVYMFDEGAPEKQDLARRHFRAAVADGSFVISTQVLQEFHVAVTRKLQTPVPPEAAEAALEEFFRLPVVLVDTTMIGAAARTSRLHTVSFWDALIIEAAQAAGSSELLSEDLQEGRRFGSLVLTNPFHTG